MNDFFKKLRKRIGVARFFVRRRSYVVLFLVLVIVFLFVVSVFNYLLFHSLVELFSIIVAVLIFVVAWNSRHRLKNNYLLWIGGAYLFIAGIDLVHMLAYEGMGVFSGYGPNLPTQLWISARYMEASALFIAPFLLGSKREVSISYPIYFYSVIFIAFFVSIYQGFFPVCFVEESGLTQFKVISEYIISILLVLGLYLLYKERKEFDGRIFNLLSVALVLTIFSELAFTFYIDVYGFSNLIGHLFKLLSFYLVYNALIVTGIMEPFSLLFREREEAVEREKFLHSLLRHEVGNKVQVIRGYVDLAEEDDLSEEARNYLLKAKNGAEGAIDIIEKVKTLTKLPEEDIQKLKLKSLIREVLDDYRRSFDGEIELICDGKNIVLGGPLLREVFSNILENAIKHTDCDKIKITCQERKKIVKVSIEDNGCGLSEKDNKKVFEKGFKDEETGGSGLGLYLVKEITESYGGRIETKDSELGGARFEITLKKA